MSHDEDRPDNRMENRRLVARKTIHPASIDELRVETVFSTTGLQWLAAGVGATVIPLMIVLSR